MIVVYHHRSCDSKITARSIGNSRKREEVSSSYVHNKWLYCPQDNEFSWKFHEGRNGLNEIVQVSSALFPMNPLRFGDYRKK
jgi:hypothetical protein